MRWILTLLLLLLPLTAEAQSSGFVGTLTSGHEKLTVSSAAKGITANLCGSGNNNGAMLQVLGDAVYLSLYSATATPANTDFLIPAGTILAVQPASRVRMIRVTSDVTVIVQCYE